MSLRRLVLRSLLFHWRTGVAVCLGLALATAVITGSLLLGDSVTGSLRDTALARLGGIDHALTAPHFFREKLADDLEARFAHKTSFGPQVEAVVQTTAAARAAEEKSGVAQSSVWGVRDDFWSLLATPVPRLSGRQAAVNAALANDLGLRLGDPLILTVGRPGAAPVDSLFGRRQREETTRVLRLSVAAILPGGAGDFRPDPSPAVPRNVFVSRDWLAQSLGRAGQANALLVSGGDDSAALQQALGEVCRLPDYGLQAVVSPDRRYLSVQTPAVALSPAIAETAQAAARAVGAKAELTSVYLATTLVKVPPTGYKPYPPPLLFPEPGEPGVTLPHAAYAVVAGLEPMPRFTFRAGGTKPLDDEGIWLNAWVAQDVQAQVGDVLQLNYLAPTPEGDYQQAWVRLTVRGIVEMTGYGADRGLVPDFEGITDAKTIEDWKPPFPVDLGLVTKRDEDYWAQYRAAPKAFVTSATARQMWEAGQGRANAGWITSVRAVLPGEATPRAQAALGRALLRRLQPGKVGMAFTPVRAQALAAARGTTDFSQLMLGMSMFLVLSGAGLAAMLMRLAAQRRAAETGLLLASGLSEQQVRRVALGEGAILTGVGALLGVPLGVLYAAAVLVALGHWWSGAIAQTALWLHVEPSSLIGGGLAGLVVGAVAALWGVRGLQRRRVLDLLAGWQALGVLPATAARRWVGAGLALTLSGAAALAGASLGAGRVSDAAAFFIMGALLLAGGLLGGWLALSAALSARHEIRSVARLALRSAAANRGRSLLTIGLLAAATFVIVATAANSRSFSRLDYARRDSGTGGFALRAIATLPLYYDLGTPGGRAHLGFSPRDEATFSGVKVFSFLMSPGEDISCLNLARPGERPRLLGVPPALQGEERFQVVVPGGSRYPWRELEGAADPWEGIPAFGDEASVTWSLHSGLGKTLSVAGEGDRAATLRFVGLLSGSIFQSELLVSEEHFRQLYPSVPGPRYFLLEVPPGREEAVAEALRRNLGDLGLEVRTTREVLDSYLRVQNTYLSMFVALGGLGVLLGTVGMVTVLLRSALERRSEFALLLATGFGRRDLTRLLVLENGALLMAGVLLGTDAALVAVAPQLAAPTAQPQWVQPAVLLAAIVALGLTACWAAARMAVQGNLLVALREE